MRNLILPLVLIAALSPSQPVLFAQAAAKPGDSAQDKAQQGQKTEAENKAGGESGAKSKQAGEVGKCTAVVLLRAVIQKSGEVKDVTILKVTPEGLSEKEREEYTGKAIEAVRKLKFGPPKNGGRPASQSARFEYCFNVY